jgi:hypothetical protein
MWRRRMVEVICDEKKRKENTHKREDVIAKHAFIAATRFCSQAKTIDAGTLHRR